MESNETVFCSGMPSLNRCVILFRQPCLMRKPTRSFTFSPRVELAVIDWPALVNNAYSYEAWTSLFPEVSIIVGY